MAHNLQAFLQEYFGDQLPFDDADSNVTVTTTSSLLVKSNAKTIILRFTNLGGFALFVGRDPTVSTANAVAVIQPGQTLFMDALIDFTEVIRAWWGIASPASTVVHISQSILTGTNPKAS